MPSVMRILKIVAICLAVGVVLLLRRPPKPGDAAITGVEEELLARVPAQRPPLSRGEAPREWLSIPKEDHPSLRGPQDGLRGDRLTPVEAVEAGEAGEAGAVSPDRVGAEAQALETPVGTVDARNCAGLNYNQVMRGAVSTRMVWNGHTFVPQKVCVVKEGGSVASVWSFEQSSSAIVSELQAASKAP